ncbi:MAG: DUF438 domain-containing protein [Thermofilaceae archaeon]|nr:DUF438 domain-containing protein [Thermofilaceae archaeon]MCX8179760.1 DUF438 domain-containing protein [Thermofilaceae archaeon]MDW8004287.1 DUF438 domain-containing protein [Thermofilaceae archaeon]
MTSSNDGVKYREKVELVKNVLRKLCEGSDPLELKKELESVIAEVNLVEIPLIEQQLVKGGVPVQEVLKLFDLHVALFRDFLGGIANVILADGKVDLNPVIDQPKTLLRNLRNIRIHYKKIQMLIFPYL